MACTPKLVPFFLMVLFCMVLIQQASGCNSGHGCFYVKAAAQEIDNRKVLSKSSPTNVHGSSKNRNGYGGEESMEEGWELRKVPSGPDPLHHNGGSPKKPTIP
ncbi:unnamed protein product [Camellia sinensis]